MNASHAAVLPNASSVAVAAATALAEVDCEADLEAFSAVAEDSMRNGDALSSRQAEMVDHLWRELLGSAEIVRQGDVQLLDQGRGGWRNGYAVLTRAGFLHWFPARQQDGSEGVQPSAWGADGGPTCSLNLARCEFEQGEAPCWRLIEGSSGGLNGWLAGKGAAQTLRTKDVEACMDWTADVREVIAVCTNKR